ncbi:MAG: YlbF family regulator [Lachnospiraceae bacterium]
MGNVKEITQTFINSFKETEEYQNYKISKEQVLKIPGLMDDIIEYKEKSYELQNLEDEDLFDKIDAFEKKYEEFCQISVVSDYLAAEIIICKCLQDVSVSISETIDLDADFVAHMRKKG